MRFFWVLFLVCMFKPFAHATQADCRTIEILSSGDGNSPQTAFKVYNVTEEYKILRFLNFPPEKQQLLIINGKHFDVFELDDVKIYFQIQQTLPIPI